MRRNTNRRITLKARPEGMPKESDFALVETPLPEVGPGQVLCRSIYLSIDPWQRTRLHASGFNYGDTPNAMALGAAVPGEVVAEVAESRDPNFKPGDIVTSFSGWQDYAALPGSILRRVDPTLAPLSTAVGVLGMPGLTGWAGMVKLAEPKAGETVFVSSATGGVGTIASQLAKARGARVVGVAGSAAKCRFAVETLGLDACLNHRDKDFAAQVKAACPKGIDVNFENAGGAIFWTALNNLNTFGRMVICGLISTYNQTGFPQGTDMSMELLRQIAIRQAHVHGIIVSSYFDQYPAFLAEVAGLMRAGRFKYHEDVMEGLESAPRALIRLLEGENFGKLLVRIAPEPTSR